MRRETLTSVHSNATMETVEEDECDVIWAVNSSGNIVSAAAAAKTDGGYTCIGCDGRLALRCAHSRTRKLNGIERTSTVRAHFCHSGTRPETCTGESVAHKGGKRVFLLYHPPVYYKCALCETRVPVDYNSHGDLSDWEGEEEVCFADFRLDVGFRDSRRRAKGAIEIYNTHRISDEKAEKMTREGLAWAEVTAKAALGWSDGQSVEAIRAASDLCSTCAQREETIRTKQQAALESALYLSEAKARVQKKRIAEDVGRLLDEADERVRQDIANARATLQGSLASQVLAAIATVRKTPVAEMEKHSVQTVLCAPSDALGWGDKYRWLSLKEIAKKDATYFTQVLLKRAPDNVKQAAKEAREALKLCVTCKQSGVTLSGSTECTDCWSAANHAGKQGGKGESAKEETAISNQAKEKILEWLKTSRKARDLRWDEGVGLRFGGEFGKKLYFYASRPKVTHTCNHRVNHPPGDQWQIYYDPRRFCFYARCKGAAQICANKEFKLFESTL